MQNVIMVSDAVFYQGHRMLLAHAFITGGKLEVWLDGSCILRVPQGNTPRLRAARLLGQVGKLANKGKCWHD